MKCLVKRDVFCELRCDLSDLKEIEVVEFGNNYDVIDHNVLN